MKPLHSTWAGPRVIIPPWAVSSLLFSLFFVGASVARVEAATHKESATLSDDDITKTVKDEMLFAKGVVVGDIDVVTLNGVVTLTGKASTLLEKERAASIAKTVIGVRSVINEIAVMRRWDRTDTQLQKDAMTALMYDPATKAWHLDVRVDNRAATLTGKVNSWRERELAETVVKGVRGITEVNSDIKIKMSAVSRTDRDIEAEVHEMLDGDVLVDDTFVYVNVKNGKVMLGGTVGSAAEKREAYSDAWVTGVNDVDDTKLEVKPWARNNDIRKTKTVTRSDEDIEKAVTDAIMYDPRVNDEPLEVTVNHGTIILAGTVDNLYARRSAERDAWNTVGVSSVVNHIRAEIESPTDDELVRRLQRIFSWDVYIGPFKVDVAVKNGIAHLSGQVDSNFEKARADDLAAATVGIQGVENDIEIQERVDHQLVFNPYLYPYSARAYDWYGQEGKAEHASKKADR